MMIGNQTDMGYSEADGTMPMNESGITESGISTPAKLGRIVKDWFEKALTCEKRAESKMSETEHTILSFSPKGEGFLVSWQHETPSTAFRDVHE